MQLVKKWQEMVMKYPIHNFVIFIFNHSLHTNKAHLKTWPEKNGFLNIRTSGTVGGLSQMWKSRHMRVHKPKFVVVGSAVIKTT